MVLAPLAFALVTAIPRPALIEPHAVLHGAIVAAAHRSAPLLEQHRRGELYRLSPKTGRQVAGAIIGVAAGLFGSIVVGFAASGGECGPAPAFVISATAGGGALGWLLAGK